MRLPKLPPKTRSTLERAGSTLRDAMTPTIRLGVTGLSRAGKTVFITALVRALQSGGRLPFFAAEAESRILSAVLVPQPDDTIPRFDYEDHLAALGADPPAWPESTRRISELRIVLTYRTASPVAAMLGPQRLNVDIVDYPGEWLIDLGLLDQSYADWSAEAIAKAEAQRRAALSADWRAFVAKLDATSKFDDALAVEGARLYTAYLAKAKALENGVGALTPGRFLMPGDLDGSPMLTFFPLAASQAETSRAFATEFQRRFELYKRRIVKPFFSEHFLRLDRQIVLVDVLSALSQGPEATADLEDALASVLKAFRPGTNSWLKALFQRRIDRVLFAATKADHLNHKSHDRLEAVLAQLTLRANRRAAAAGAGVEVMALAALRATREAEVRVNGEMLPCIAGIPLPGEVVDGQTFDGKREAVIFPGDLPADPLEALDRARTSDPTTRAAFVRFRPPRLPPSGADGELPAAPHIRLDRAMQFLLGDRIE